MTIWVRLVCRIRSTDETKGSDGSLKLTPELYIIAYASKEHAEESRQTLGGILLEVEAASLGLKGQNELGKHMIFVPSESEENRGPIHGIPRGVLQGTPACQETAPK